MFKCVNLGQQKIITNFLLGLTIVAWPGHKMFI